MKPHDKFAIRLSQIVSLSILAGAIVAIGVTACKSKITESADVTGNNNPDILKPVIRATNAAVTGSISGVIQPVETRAIIYGINNSDTVATALADTSSGVFKITGLNPGPYTLSIIPAGTTVYRDTTLTHIDVSTRETRQLGTISLMQK